MLHVLLYFQVKQEKWLELSFNYQEVIEVWGIENIIEAYRIEL